jgi:hypothetical protein
MEIPAVDSGAPAAGGAPPAPRVSMVKDVRDIAFVATIYLFFTGFVARYFYLTAFGISPPAIPVDFRSVLVFAFDVLYDHTLAVCLATGAGFVLWAFVVRRLPRLSQVAIAGTVAVLVFPLLFLFALSTEERNVLEIRTGDNADKKRTSLALNATARFPPFILNAANNDALYVIAENDQFFFVFYQPPPRMNSPNLRDAFTYAVRKTDIDHFRVSIPGVEGAYNEPSLFKKVLNALF